MLGNFGGGDGRASTPFLIEDAEDLMAVNDTSISTINYKLVNDIDCVGLGVIEPITGAGGASPQRLNVDGAGFTIKNLRIESTEDAGLYVSGNRISFTNIVFEDVKVVGGGRAAVVSVTSAGSTLKNIILRNCEVTSMGDSAGVLVSLISPSTSIEDIIQENCKVKGLSNVGGLAGISDGAGIVIMNCELIGQIVEGNGGNIGGFIGSVLLEPNISGIEVAVDVFNTGTLPAVGGFIGYASPRSRAIIRKCRTSGRVYAPSSNEVGGFFGNLRPAATLPLVQLCGADCDVTGNTFVGGFTGYTTGTSTSNLVQLRECYAIGTVKGVHTVGGLVGYFMRGNVANSYANNIVDTESGTTSGLLFGEVNMITSTNLYTAGSYKITGQVGKGFIGTIRSSSTFTDCYNDTTKGVAQVISGLLGVSSEELELESTFNGWDFINLWSIVQTPQFFDLPEFPNYGVTGVVDINGVPVAGAEVILFGHNRLYSKKTTELDGSYKFKNLIPERRLMVVAHYYDGTDIYTSTSYPNILPVVLI